MITEEKKTQEKEGLNNTEMKIQNLIRHGMFGK